MKAEVAAQVAGVGAASAVTMAWLGLPIQPIVWAIIGSFVGSSWAPPMSGLRALLMYPASALLAARFGHLLAHHWFADDIDWAMGLAGVLAVMFHPLLAAVVAAVPAVVARLAGKVEVKQ